MTCPRLRPREPQRVSRKASVGEGKVEQTAAQTCVSNDNVLEEVAARGWEAKVGLEGPTLLPKTCAYSSQGQQLTRRTCSLGRPGRLQKALLERGFGYELQDDRLARMTLCVKLRNTGSTVCYVKVQSYAPWLRSRSRGIWRAPMRPTHTGSPATVPLRVAASAGWVLSSSPTQPDQVFCCISESVELHAEHGTSRRGPRGLCSLRAPLPLPRALRSHTPTTATQKHVCWPIAPAHHKDRVCILLS